MAYAFDLNETAELFLGFTMDDEEEVDEEEIDEESDEEELQ
jgi:hypothetical protein